VHLDRRPNDFFCQFIEWHFLSALLCGSAVNSFSSDHNSRCGRCIEVNQQPDFPSANLEICKKLRFVNRQEHFDRLDLTLLR
jgi:hypothetical protein